MPHHLAQLNIARLRAPIDAPETADFVANLDGINALADAAPGFVWRLQTPEGHATSVRPYGDDRLIVNMSVWRDLESLHAFSYKTAHAAVMARRREWFDRLGDAFLVLWWVPEGEEPTVEQAVERLDHLRAHGPTPFAFTFKSYFPPPGE